MSRTPLYRGTLRRVPGRDSVQCSVCQKFLGLSDKREAHIRGHAPCELCGAMLTLTPAGYPRKHGKNICPAQSGPREGLKSAEEKAQAYVAKHGVKVEDLIPAEEPEDEGQIVPELKEAAEKVKVNVLSELKELRAQVAGLQTEREAIMSGLAEVWKEYEDQMGCQRDKIQERLVALGVPVQDPVFFEVVLQYDGEDPLKHETAKDRAEALSRLWITLRKSTELQEALQALGFSLVVGDIGHGDDGTFSPIGDIDAGYEDSVFYRVNSDGMPIDYSPSW